jgi:hypothetical protein
MFDQPELMRRATEYCLRVRAQLGPQLGYGVHGTVFTVQNQTDFQQSAVKIHERERPYQRERDVYRRLAEERVSAVRNCRVPRMLRYDDELWVIEMSIVTAPYLLDFAGGYLDEKRVATPSRVRPLHSCCSAASPGRCYYPANPHRISAGSPSRI